MKIKVNENFADVKESYLFSDIAKRAREYAEKHPDKKIIKLGIGDVTLPLGDSVVKALKSASDEMGVKETFRGYPPEYGYDFLKEAIIKHYKRNGVEVTADSVFVSDGAKSDCGNIVDILGNNEILIPSPVYPVYMDSNIMSGRKITLFEGNRENGFLPMPDCLGKGKEGCVVYLCSPNNPTGAVYSENQLEKWVNWANDTGSLIIFDSAYECFINGDYPHSIFKVPGAESCAIEICSFSKMAGFTGTRCGWTVIPESLSAGEFSLNKLWKRRQATKFNGVSYPVQRAAEAALSEQGMKECMENINYYMTNAKLLAELFTKKGIYFTGGISSPYIWLKCPDNMGSWEFFDYLLNTVSIIGTPGEGFGKAGEGYFRLTAFGSREATQEAIERLDKIL